MVQLFEYLKRFIQHVKPSNNNIVLLIYDSHGSAEVVTSAKEMASFS
jgi:hypothetical protein